MTALSSQAVAQCAGVTYRRLRSWVPTLLVPAVPAPSRGYAAEFNDTHVKVAMVLNEIADHLDDERLFLAAVQLGRTRAQRWTGFADFTVSRFTGLVVDLGAVQTAADEAVATLLESGVVTASRNMVGGGR